MIISTVDDLREALAPLDGRLPATVGGIPISSVIVKDYYQKKVEMVTGPSHLPELFNAHPQEPPHLAPCKAAFRDFYHWFLKERYLRYLLLDGKMTNKMAYIEYKNTHLFKFVAEEEPPRMHRARTRSTAKLEDAN